MKKTRDPKVEAKSPERDAPKERRPYESPRLVKKRPVSRATLFTGGGPDSGGVIGG